MTSSVPFTVTADLEAGVAHAHPWGIALDGLLAGALHAADKAALLAAGGARTPLVDQDDPADLDLPLARCHTGEGAWHWMATCSWPTSGNPSPPDPRYWTRRVDHAVAAELAAGLPSTISDQRGRYRAHYMPVLVTVTDQVTWRGVGDPVKVRQLLRPLAAIGKKRAAGHGRVLRWRVDPDPSASAWEAGHLHPDHTLGRPCPPECLRGRDVAHAGLGPAGLRPPYHHRSRQAQLFRPLGVGDE